MSGDVQEDRSLLPPHDAEPCSMLRAFLLLIPRPREAIRDIGERPSWSATALFLTLSATCDIVYLLTVGHASPNFPDELRIGPVPLVALLLACSYFGFAVGIILLHYVCRASGGDGVLLVTATILAAVLAMTTVIWISVSSVVLVLARGEAMSQMLMISAHIWQVALVVLGVSHAYQLGAGRSLLAVFVVGLAVLVFIVMLLR